MFESLKSYHGENADRSILSLFETPGRAEEYSCACEEMIFDYSKTNIF